MFKSKFFFFLIIISLSKEEPQNYETYVLSIQYTNNVCETSSNKEKCYENIKYTPKNRNKKNK